MAALEIDEVDISTIKVLKSLSTDNNRVHDPQHAKVNTECWDCAWSPDNTLFAWSCGRRIIRIVPVNTFNRSDANHGAIQIDCRQIVTSVAFGALAKDKKHVQHCICPFHKFDDALILAAGLRNGRIRTYDVKSGLVLLELVDHTDVVSHLSFAPDGSLHLISVSQDCTIKLWDLEDDGNMMKTFKSQDAGVKHVINCVAWSPDSTHVATVGTSKMVAIWDMVKKTFWKRFLGHYHDVRSCDFSPDGMLLVTASCDTSAIVWNSFSGQIIVKLGHLFPPPSPIFAGGANDSYVLSSLFSNNGLIVSTVGLDGLVRFWDLRKPENPIGVCRLDDPLCSSYKPDGKMLAVGTRDGSVFFLNTPKVFSSLKQISRLHVNRMLEDKRNTHQLPIPNTLVEYLCYRHPDF